MAIIKEQINDKLVRTFSDEGHKIIRVDNNQIYEEAIDPINLEREYLEVVLEEDADLR